MEICQLTEDDWESYRDLRLASLRADPGAFGSTYAREAEFDEATWRLRLTVGPLGKPNAIFSAALSSDDPLVGTAGVAYTEHHPSPMLVAMWVHPDVRGYRVGHRLVDAAVEWAQQRGDDSMVLWVVQDNAPAITLYERCGFEMTGSTDTLPHDPTVIEVEMLRRW